MEILESIPDVVECGTVGVPLAWDEFAMAVITGEVSAHSDFPTNSVGWIASRRICKLNLEVNVLDKLVWLSRHIRLRSAYNTQGEVGANGLYVKAIPDRKVTWQEYELWLAILTAFSKKFDCNIDWVRLTACAIFSKQAYGPPYFLFLIGSDGAHWVDIAYSNEQSRSNFFMRAPNLIDAQSGICVCKTIAQLRCGICRKQFYCSATCQKHHWKAHKNVCMKQTQSPEPSLIVITYVELYLRKKIITWSRERLINMAEYMMQLPLTVRTRMCNKGVYRESDGRTSRGTTEKDQKRALHFFNANSENKTLHVGITQVEGTSIWERNVWIEMEGTILDLVFPKTDAKVLYFGYEEDWNLLKPYYVYITLCDNNVSVLNINRLVTSCIEKLAEFQKKHKGHLDTHDAVEVLRNVYDSIPI